LVKEVQMKVYMGIDWSERKHDVCIINERGEVIQQLVIGHTPEGFLELDTARRRMEIGAQECVVGLETAHNLLIDFLWDQGYEQVYVLPPNAVKSAQGRYRQSGAKSDASDARLIADMLRTDQGRYSAWKPDQALTRQMRAKVSLVLFLTRSIVRTENRLRAVLLRYYPAALEVFSSLDAPITLAFIQEYASPAAAAQLTFSQFKDFLKQHRHTQPKKWAGCYARLQRQQPQADPAILAVYSSEARLLANLLDELVRAKNQALQELEETYQQHPDHEIFSSLPGVGAFLGPALLSKFGDDRQRFPSPTVLQAIAGTCPVTDASGKRKSRLFRRACDHEFRHIAQQWAKLSIHLSPWAHAYYGNVRPHCSSDNDAYRRLANRWLAIAWKLWTTRQSYNETYHLKQRALRSRPRS
jgi:transposase